MTDDLYATVPAAAPQSSQRSSAADPIGVLLVNLGTPASTRVADVRRYLRQFLSDPDVVQANRVVWWAVLNGIVLPFRASKSARLYERVWTAQGSPLLVYSRMQRDALARALGSQFHVVLGMRYGEPSLSHALAELRGRGCRRVILFTLFPQRSRTTTGSIEREVERLLARDSTAPEIVRVPDWSVRPSYVRALAVRVREARTGRDIDHHVFSFHGIPQSYVERGDGYRDQCEATAVALARALELERRDWSLVFQSRFGPQPWLQPYADQYVPSLASRHKRVLVTTPGFVADCLETLEEIRIRLNESFVEAGGEALVVVPALNDHPAWTDAMADLVADACASSTGDRASG